MGSLQRTTVLLRSLEPEYDLVGFSNALYVTEGMEQVNRKAIKIVHKRSVYIS
jgi:hypothetical protein